MRLPARSLNRIDRPVTLPPGRAKWATKPLPTGSAPARTRSGSSWSPAWPPTALPTVMMTIHLEPNNSAANSANRSLLALPSDTRSRPCGPRPSRVRAGRCTKAAVQWLQFDGVLAPSSPMVGIARLLRPRREWRERRRAAEKCEEFPPLHCTTIFFSLITRPHSAVSSAKNLAASAGVPSIGSSVSFCNRSAISGRLRLSLTS